MSTVLLVACGSRFTSGEYENAGETGAGSGNSSASTSLAGSAGSALSAGDSAQHAGNGGASSLGGTNARAGSDDNASGAGAISRAGAGGSGGILAGTAGSSGTGGINPGGGIGGTIGSSGAAGVGISGGGAGGWSPCTPALTIDDMEDGNDRNCPNQGRNGEWWASNGTTTGTTDPPKTGEFPAYALGSDARAHSNYGMRLSGKGYGHTDSDWASLGFNLIDNNSYDLTGYQGLAFYAKSKAGTLTVHVEFATDTTTATAEGGACKTKCNDHWSKSVSVDGGWHEFSVPFSTLAQEGWGVQPKDLAHTRFIFFGFLGTDGGPADFEFLIDDVRLY